MMELSELKKFFNFALFACIVFAAMMFYLLFFNFGLNIVVEKTPSGETVFFVKNMSTHTIKDVSVEINAGEQKSELMKVKELFAGEQKQIEMPKTTQALALLTVKAPFHLSVEQKINLEKTQELSISYDLGVPQDFFVGLEFKMKLNVCNKAAGENKVIVKETHSTDFFKEEDRTELLFLGKEQCEEITYSLTPKSFGKTIILFNIKALDYSEIIEQKIEVK